MKDNSKPKYGSMFIFRPTSRNIAAAIITVTAIKFTSRILDQVIWGLAWDKRMEEKVKNLRRKNSPEPSIDPVTHRRGCVTGTAYGRNWEALRADALKHAREFFPPHTVLEIDSNISASRSETASPEKRFAASVRVWEIVPGPPSPGKEVPSPDAEGKPGPSRRRPQSKAAGSERKRQAGSRPETSGEARSPA